MFQLHDKTRRKACLAAFLLLCVLPTTTVLAWCVYRHRPGYVDAEALRLSRELGLEVSIERFQRLRPGSVLYEGMELTDPESGRSVLRCRVLQAAWRDVADARGEKKPTLMLIASQPIVEVEAFDALGQLIARRLRRRAGQTAVDVRLTAAEVTLRAAEHSDTLTEFQGTIETLPGGRQARAHFRPTGSTTAEPVAIRLFRGHQTVPSTIAFELDTRGCTVPCRVLAMGFRPLEPLGLRSRFRGYVWAKQTPDADSAPPLWDGKMTGALLDVDLDDLISANFPHTLSGTATIEIQQARFQQGRLESASGTLVAGPGLDGSGLDGLTMGTRAVIGRSLIDAAVEQLGLVRGLESRTPGDLVPYEQLALAFLIDAEGLRLQGRSAVGGPGTVLVDRYGRLLSTSDAYPRPVVALLRALVPQSEVQVPATRQTDWLMRYLPIPDVTPPPTTDPPPPQVRLHFNAETRSQ
ncbi:MAG: hypothetical protein V3R99_09820 [Thermoguttaceae bacterium]